MIAYRLTTREIARRLLRLQSVAEMTGTERLVCLMASDLRGAHRAEVAQQQALAEMVDLRVMLAQQGANR